MIAIFLLISAVSLTPEERAAITKIADKQNLAIAYDSSLKAELDGLLDGHTTTKDMSHMAIELDDFYDTEWTILQVLGKGSAILTSTASRFTLILRDYQEELIEGSRLTDLDLKFVRVIGTKNYQTRFGTKQAIVIVDVY